MFEGMNVNCRVLIQWNLSLSPYKDTSELKTPLYTGHFHLFQLPYLCI